MLVVVTTHSFDYSVTVVVLQKLFDDERWDILIELFWKTFIKSQWFTNDASSLCILLESGITALKVPYPNCLHSFVCVFYEAFVSSLHNFFLD